ncbi:TAT-variant-translocated molybdopterin oxidoreductase [Marinobacteraceae bacterium S3BR75-40.1]
MPPIEPKDYGKLRQRLAGKDGVGYWRSLAELADSGEYRELASREFPDALQFWQAPVSRRRILKLLGASMALAGLTACTRQPEEHIVPYVRMPEYLVPGQARFYATAAMIGGYAHGLLAESHEGRPTKIEGNPDHPATQGACDAISQASVLSLYDPDRSAAVRHRETPSNFGACLAALSQKQSHWNERQGEGLSFLTETITSPSQQAAMEKLRQRWPKARWFVHEPVDRNGVYGGSQRLFGRPLEPYYRFDQVRVVVSLDADFMQAQPGFLRYARDWMAQRRPRDNEGGLARLYAVESSPGVTGASADHRVGLAYPRVESAARELASALGLAVDKGEKNVLDEAWLKAVVEELQAHQGRALVVPGDQQPAVVHALAHAMNEQLGAFNRSVFWIEPQVTDPAAEGLEALTEAIHEGKVQDLVVMEANPVYTAPGDLGFREAFDSVPWRLHWGAYRDETARLSHWHVPAAHSLESWGDARAYDGTVSIIQPLIQPLRGGLTALQMWHAFGTAVEADPRKLLMDHWRNRHEGDDFDRFWRRSLHDGVVPASRARTLTVQVDRERFAALPPANRESDGLLLQFRPDPALWDGRHANNGWLQEMPRPLTTLTWNNALHIGPAVAEKYGLDEGDVVKISTAAGFAKVPVYVLPGQPPDTATLNLGFGREGAGRVAQGIGTNAFAVRSRHNPWAMPVELEKTGEYQQLSAIQAHHHIEGRDVLREADWEHYQRSPHFAQHESEELSLYPEPWPAERESDNAWGMAIDLSACIGCNACVTACQAENNIPIVGPEEVARGHDMHWIRVDRYFSDSLEAPGITFQPVPCMHCENAPCEYVCPVGATQHSADGINEMLYQRCIGTRYCSQNCPYKVRRFNWFDFTSAAATYSARPAVQNPDVTVRQRGVMEKCTYCVQRITEVRRRAESEEREIHDGEIQPSCQQACPTEAIVFGDLAKKGSQVNRLKSHPLNYAMLGEVNTRPRTTYLAAVRNPNPALKKDKEQG